MNRKAYLEPGEKYAEGFCNSTTSAVRTANSNSIKRTDEGKVVDEIVAWLREQGDGAEKAGHPDVALWHRRKAHQIEQKWGLRR